MIDDRTHLIKVLTPEGVAFSFRVASPALRLVALLIDLAVIAAAWSVIQTVIHLLDWVSADLAGTVAIVGYFVLSVGYRIFAEWKWRGQTLGKRMMHLRVVDERGLRLTFAQIVLRNLLRAVDALPAMYLVGGVTALVSARGQRLGDLAAGTVVAWEPAEPAPDFSVLRGEKYNSLRDHLPVTARLRQAISPAEARVAWQALARRDRLNADARIALFGQLAERFRQTARLPVDLVEGVTDEQLVRNVVDILFISRK